MPSAVLNWSTVKFLPAVGVATNVPAFYARVLADIGIATGAADFPWTVASISTETAYECITFKRKSGAPGRIVFGLNKTTAAINPSVDLFTSGPLAANTLFMFYIEGATSDTPTNIKGSGQIFVGEDLENSTPIAYNALTESATTGRPCLIANEDSIWIMARRDLNSLSTPGNALAAGGILVNDADVVYNAVVNSTGAGMSKGGNLTTSMSRTTQGILHRRTPTGELEQWALSPDSHSSVQSFLRDLALKKAYFYPANLASITAISPERLFYFTLRQVGYGPGSLVDFEELRDGSGNLRAVLPSKNTSGEISLWFCGFKLNV